MLRLSALLSALLLLAVGCDTSGIHPVGKILDITPNCDPMADADHTTWMRTMVNSLDQPIGTELVVFGFDPKAPPGPGLGSHCMQRIKVYRSTTTEEHLGVVNITAAGEATHTEGVRCSFPQEPGRGVLSRRGAQCYDLNFRGTIDSDFTFAMAAGDILEITWADDEAELIPEDFTGGSPRAPEMLDRIAAGTYRYREVGDVLGDLDTGAMSGAVGTFQIFNIALLASQSRLAGFGSGGMTQYLNTTSSFVGLINSEYTVNVVNFAMPRTTIRYDQFEDLTGLVIGAPGGENQVTIVNTSGNGGMEGALSFYLQRDRTDPSSAIVGSLDYIDVEINNGFGNGGTYHIYLEESDTTFDLDVAAMIGYDDALPGYGNFDLSPILPPTL